MRTTLPEMDATAALKNLTLPEDFFQINEAELSQLYGIFPDIQWIECVFVLEWCVWCDVEMVEGMIRWLRRAFHRRHFRETHLHCLSVE